MSHQTPCRWQAAGIEALFAAGAPLEAVNAAGETPLLAALQREKKECVLALLAAGAVVPPSASASSCQPQHQSPAAGRLGGCHILQACFRLAADGSIWAFTGRWGSSHSGQRGWRHTPALSGLRSCCAYSRFCRGGPGGNQCRGPNTVALSARLPKPGPWMTALFPANRSISPQQLAEWVEAGIAAPLRRWSGSRICPTEAVKAAKQELVWQVWALRSRLPPELLVIVAAMCCILP